MLATLQARPIRMRHLMPKCILFAAVAAAALGMAEPAAAQPVDDGNSLTLYFNQALYSGGSSSVNNPSSTKDGSDWLIAIIKNGTAANTVELTLQSKLTAASGAFISSAAFNLDGNAAIQSVTCGPSPICVSPTYSLNYDGVNMSNGIQGLDLELLFATSNAADRLDGEDTVSFLITGTGLTYQSFNAAVDPAKNGVENLYTAARLQGYGGSATLLDGPPESAPGPLPILGLVAAFQASRRLRRRLRLATAETAGKAPAQPTA
jgi:hypothetical protein